MNDWFRSWHGAPTDPKWLAIAKRAGVAPGMVSAIVWALFDHASQAADRGSVNAFDHETYSAFSGFAEKDIEAVLLALNEKRVIVDGYLSAWEKRQPKREDNSAERSKEWRERNRTQPTAEKHREEKIQIREEKKEEPRAERAPESDWPSDYREKFWSAYPKREEKQAAFRILERLRKSGTVSFGAILSAVERYAISVRGTDRRFIKQPPKWLNAGCWDDELTPASTPVAIPLNGIVAPGLIHIQRESPEWPIYAERYRREKGKDPPTDAKGGWSFPADWAARKQEEAA